VFPAPQVLLVASDVVECHSGCSPSSSVDRSEVTERPIEVPGRHV
jgi:hypothetical protein